MVDYIAYYVILNFVTSEKELNFGDFKIISIKQGPEATKWRNEIGCKVVPKNILIKEFPNYNVAAKGDLTGYDRITSSTRNLLLLFRLYKLGDIFFYDSKIKEKGSKNGSITLYDVGRPSSSRYFFDEEEIEKFNNFRTKLENNLGYKNIFFDFTLNHFMSGVNNPVFYNPRGLNRIVDYIMALESLFLIDNKRYFLRKTFAKRIAKFLNDNSLEKLCRFMYDERSKIVHGSYIGSKADNWERIKSNVKQFEKVIRQVLIKLSKYNFATKNEIIIFMQKLYNPPAKALDLMITAKKEAEKLL